MTGGLLLFSGLALIITTLKVKTAVENLKQETFDMSELWKESRILEKLVAGVTEGI